MLTNLITGGGTRKTRLHDEQGNMIPASRALRHGPRAFVTAVARRAFNYRSVQPWISYDAQAVIDAHLTKASRVLEFGSGMSTVWYAERAGDVVSTEDYEPWFDQVNAIIAARSIANIHYKFARNADEYTSFTDEERGDGFDLIMVDGSVRDLCIRRSLDLLRPRGMLYLDNSDMGSLGATGDIPAGRALILDHARTNGASVRFFTDFAPTQMHVQQGLMMQLAR